MYRASVGGRDAAHAVYRHALVRLMSPLLGVLGPGRGWSAFTLGLAAVMMSWDPAPTLAQRFEAVRAVLDGGWHGQPTPGGWHWRSPTVALAARPPVSWAPAAPHGRASRP